MKKKVLLLYILFSFIFGSLAFSGELSNFEILGFNDNLTNFAFAEYGINSRVQPYANIFIIDIARNEFLPNGVFKDVYSTSTSIEENGKAALFAEILKASNSLKSYNIDPLNQGNLIYILLDSEDTGDSFSFTDYETGYSYDIKLIQDIQGTGVSARGAFHIQLGINKNGQYINKTIGTQGYYRDGVALYKIRSIYSTSDNNSLVFVIEKTSYDADGESNIHYMVETASLRY